MANPSSRPTLATMKKTVLRTIQGLVSKALTRGIEILFSPCCDPAVTAVTTCGSGPDLYNVTYTIANPPNLLDRGYLQIIIGGKQVQSLATPYTGQSTITLTDVAFGDDSSLVFYMPTGQETFDFLAGFTPGVYLIAYVGLDLPSCPPPVSDMRLKTNIESIGVSPSGIPIYNFDYVESVGMPGRYQGAMAQDLLGTVHADAVVSGEHYRVDYSKIDVEFKKID